MPMCLGCGKSFQPSEDPDKVWRDQNKTVVCSLACVNKSNENARESLRAELFAGVIRDAKEDIKGMIRESLVEMGVVGSPQTLQIKCQRIDCQFNFSFWCQKEDGKVALDEEGLCRSYSKF